MKTIFSLGSILLMGAGCTETWEIDLTRTADFKEFKWDGTIKVRNTSQSILDSPGIDRIELGSRDGRTILIVTEGSQVRAYLEVKTKPLGSSFSRPTTAPAPPHDRFIEVPTSAASP